MGTTIIFRQARRDDIPALHRVRRAVRENRLTSTVLTEDDYVRALEPPCRTWLVEADGHVVAFAAANAATGNIWALFVDPDTRVTATAGSCTTRWWRGSGSRA